MQHPSKTALITGITGQDGAYLAEFLLGKGYEVHGIKRRASLFNTDRIDHLYQDPHVDRPALRPALRRPDRLDQPDPHHPAGAARRDLQPGGAEPRGGELREPEYTANADALGTLRLLEAIRILGLREEDALLPGAAPPSCTAWCRRRRRRRRRRSIRAARTRVAKLYAYWITVNYREAYGMYACNGILFNHESPLRGETFVTRKITRALARIALGLQDCLYLGNLDALRDWGHARDYVEMQWLMLQQDAARGLRHRHRRAVQRARVRRDGRRASSASTLRVRGRGRRRSRPSSSAVRRRARPRCKPGDVIVRVDPRYFRPTEVETLLGDPTQGASRSWAGRRKITLPELVARNGRVPTTRRRSATAWSSWPASRPMTTTNRWVALAHRKLTGRWTRFEERICGLRDFERLRVPSQAALTVICDDGQIEDLAVVDVLSRCGVHGVFAVSPGLIGRPGFMSYEQLRQVRDAGHEIAFHGTTHDPFTHQQPASLQATVRAGMAQLADHGLVATTLVYPYGANNRWVRAAVAPRIRLRVHHLAWLEPSGEQPVRIAAHSFRRLYRPHTNARSVVPAVHRARRRGRLLADADAAPRRECAHADAQ